MRQLWVIAVGMIALAGASHLHAQEMLPAQQAEIELSDYADCVVGRRYLRTPVDKFLRTIPKSDDFHDAGKKAADESCLRSAAVRQNASRLQLKMPAISFREALYPALYRRDFAERGPLEGIAALPPLVFTSEFDGDTQTLPLDYRIRRGFGDCVARAAPQPAHALLTSRPYSKRADAAIDELKPILAQCITEGQTVSLSRSGLRADIGEAMYKLSLAADAAGHPSPTQ